MIRMIINLMQSLVMSLNSYPMIIIIDSFKVCVVTFSTGSTTEMHMGRYHTSEEIIQNVLKIPYRYIPSVICNDYHAFFGFFYVRMLFS
jgi:hypothetical protein